MYDDLREEWVRPGGAFAGLHWLAAARAELVPPSPGTDAVLLDLACGGGLLAPGVTGYRHVGVDLVDSAPVPTSSSRGRSSSTSATSTARSPKPRASSSPVGR
jgi:2-polyprenyl-6-hydroxyphenyl methylase/3-demethylubiquinone-9 3-methyltransferase